LLFPTVPSVAQAIVLGFVPSRHQPAPSTAFPEGVFDVRCRQERTFRLRLGSMLSWLSVVINGIKVRIRDWPMPNI